MSPSERLKAYLYYKKISQATFAKSIGASAGYVNALNRGFGPKYEPIVRVKYPDLNMGWLLTGEGDMLKTDDIYNEEPTNLNITDMDIRNLLTAIERHGETLRMSNEELARQGARLDRVLDIIAPFKQTKVG